MPLVPKFRFPEFLANGDWANDHLGELSLILRGGSPRPIDEFITNDENGLNWLKIGDVNKEAKFITQTTDKVKKTALTKTREVNPGDLIMSNSMSFGRPYILKIKTCIHDGWIAVTEIKDVIISDYLYYFILSSGSQVYFSNAAAGGGIKNLNADIIKLLPVTFPPKTEQQKIADCLSSLDDLISAEDKKLEALKAHKKGLMRKLFPTDGETAPEWRFPEFRGKAAWEEKELLDICKMQAGNFVSATEIDDKQTPDVFPCYGGNGLRGYTKTFTHNGRYPLIGRQGALCGNVTIVEGKFHATEHAVVCTPSRGIIVDWLYFQLVMMNLNQYATGQAQPGLSVKVLEKAPIKFPTTKAEQQRIADCLTSLNDFIVTQTQKIEALKMHKKGLMQGLFPSIEEVGE